MYARSTTISARPSALDDGIKYVREQTMPALLELDGCMGLSLLVDRGSGLCIATSSWETEEEMQASARGVAPLRSTASEHFGGSLDKVETWEIAVLHRAHAAHDGTCVRCTWLETPTDGMDRALDAFKNTVLPQCEQMDGFCSASMFIDRTNGRAVGAMAWDSRSALDASRERVRELRTATTQQIGVTVTDVKEFDLALAHLRVPELV